SPDCIFIPAHAWTPHFGVLGSSSGFNSLEECFEELTPHVTAIETGLSSDPAMNWRVSSLDNVALVSNSDAHSPGKLGREANRFDTELSYFAMKEALKKSDPQKFLETIEFYPEEGKYHMDGHSACEISFTPEESAKHGGRCPKCRRPLTIGVMNRVEKLADRPDGSKRARPIPFRHVIPLPEILSDLLETGTGSKKLAMEYFKLINALGNEFDILLDVPVDEIRKVSNPIMADAIARMRNGNVHITPGYDGTYGVIKVFAPGENKIHSEQSVLFGTCRHSIRLNGRP
ncbi:MAG TPA: endonuclease Q family protein, partial [Candidatus Gracilibacteria bacterium]|nr:endonuclease Q family protein [Candidatus Gracilibacteria bacterium]